MKTPTPESANTEDPKPELKIFAFDSSAVRVLTRNNEPWFVAKDLCRILEIENSRDACAKLDKDERDDVGISDAIGREQETTIVNESGMYFLVMRCRNAGKPGHVAHSFRKWVTSEVLPALRKTGSYTAPGAQLPQPEAVMATDSFIKVMIASIAECFRGITEKITGVITRTDKLESQVHQLTQHVNNLTTGFHQHTRQISKMQVESEQNMLQTLSTDQLLSAFGEMTQTIRKMNQVPAKQRKS